jgi:hypothetical protein
MSTRRKVGLWVGGTLAVLWVIGTVAPQEEEAVEATMERAVDAESTTSTSVQPSTTTTVRPATTSTTARSTTTTSTSEGDRRVRAWADDHLDELAGAHGNIQGIVNGFGELAARGRVDDARELCEAASATDLESPPSAALRSYPGDTKLRMRWSEFARSADVLLETCEQGIAGTTFDARLDDYNTANEVLLLTVTQVMFEADGTIATESKRTKRYDEVRDTTRRQVIADVHRAAG